MGAYTVLFLDFDGVIARMPKYKDEPARARLLPDRVGRLSELIERTGSRVVVSSTWRKNPRLDVGMTASQLESLLRGRGYTGAVYDITPVHEEVAFEDDIARVRGGEILAWLRAQKQKPRAFAVLDDIALEGPVAPYLVQTNEDVGLTGADVERAVVILSRPIRGRRPWTAAPKRTRTLRQASFAFPGMA